MRALLAALPIIVILVAMIGWRWRAASAGSLGLATALFLSVAVFGFGTETLPALGPLAAVTGSLLEAAFVALTILWIVLPALCIFELQSSSGAFETLRDGLTRLSGDPRILAILVAWFFALFVEGVAGFGTPVALAAPVLVSLGFTPVQAVTLALIAHAPGVSFGAVGTPILPQMAATGLSGLALSQPSALIHALLGWIIMLFVIRLAAAGPSEPRHWRLGMLAALLFLLPYLALALLIGPELPTLGGAILGGVLFAAFLRRMREAGTTGAGPGLAALMRAALPYLVLLALVLLTRLIVPLRDALRQFAVEWTLHGDFAGGIEPFYHPGTLLFLGFLLGGLAQGRAASELAAAAGRALRRLVPVVIALVAMLGLSRILVHSDMILVLAEAAAGSGWAWPLLAPFVGVLGTFVTGSATASNILFAEFQEATAETLRLPVDLLQGAQNFGAAVGNMVCPHNIIAGSATVGLVGREGDILRATATASLVYATAGGALVLVLALSGW